ncbi:hypothetical protein B0H17DRAFT_1146039 [Mycena rosella]|uniref:CxC1-like cysteine cluster associated with KDZ transposases domain-containing protein n=1 Tax=Mycena rosella TaxID=1033263 RepID=A0AAD7CPT5_MYCRO|nr:hypothetical protein B0H17DRAFT_1146039 [Mycena rosella]
MQFSDKQLQLISSTSATPSRVTRPSAAVFPVARPKNLLMRVKPPQPEPLVFCANGKTLSQRLVHPLPKGAQSSPVRPNVDGYDDFVLDFIPSDNPPTPSHPSVKRSRQWVAVVRMNDVPPHLLQLVSVADCQAVIEHVRLILLQGGLFACSPQNPSLAVDLQVLDFVSRLFVNLPPNNTAFCNTLESFLSSRGYKLATKIQDTLRVRFGNALQWYITLQHATNDAMEQLLKTARTIVREEEPEAEQPPSPPTPTPSRPLTPPLPATPTGRPVPPAPSRPKRRRQAADAADASEEEEEEEEEKPPSNPFPEPPTHTLDVQKQRRRGARDPPHTHPNSVFVQEATADQMGVHVDEVRPARGGSAKKARTQAEEEDDKYEGASLKVPRSVLNECKSSFKAADDKREKASTKFFDDTGIMGILCRHDRVLWLVNMRTAGEKQYYVLVLLETLFQHLPANIRVGILYDIACQLHRSCVKYKFLDRYLDCILFAVSVFHPFGHCWPCQLIYHPLKYCGFGFTNGEGCKRFWHSISKLISYLRVAGYHHQLFTIDLQIEHVDKASLGRLASWLLRWTALRGQTARCTVRLGCVWSRRGGPTSAMGRPDSRPDEACSSIPGRSKTQGQAAVEQVLEARQRAQQLFERVASLEEALADEFCTPEVSLYARMNLDDARTAWKQGKDKAVRLEQQLGIDDTTQLNKVKHSKYYALQMNGRAVKERLRAKLRDRKFELDPIERSFRRTRSSILTIREENQRNEHAGAAIKRQEPNIARLVKEYNKICDQIEALIKAKKAPARAVAPVPVPAKGIYQLDVDDVIWQDLGLDGDKEGAPPLWLRDDKVRLGIRALLQKDRCHEEALRLLRERGHLQIWFTTEWRAVDEALKASTGGVRYQFELRRDELLQLYVLWKKSLDQMPFDDVHLPEWGPTDAQILACQIAGVTASWGEYDSDGGEEEEERRTTTTTTICSKFYRWWSERTITGGVKRKRRTVGHRRRISSLNSTFEFI